MSSDLPPTREDVYYYVEDDIGGLRYMTRTLQPHLKVLETWYRADLYEALRAENERLREIFQNMDDVIVARWELFISDQECLLNLRDRIRRALETKKAPGD